jgi:hypothetical protein
LPQPDANGHSNTDTYRNAYGNLYAYGNRDAYRDWHSPAHAHAETSAFAKAASNPSPAPISPNT